MDINIFVKSSGGQSAAADVHLLVSALKDLHAQQQKSGGAVASLPAAATGKRFNPLGSSAGALPNGSAPSGNALAARGVPQNAAAMVASMHQQSNALNRATLSATRDLHGLQVAISGLANTARNAVAGVRAGHTTRSVGNPTQALPQALPAGGSSPTRLLPGGNPTQARSGGNMDLLFAGGIIAGGGAAAMQLPKFGLDQYGQARRAQIGVEAIEGGNAAKVTEQARADALDMFGASYRDVLSNQMQLRQAGQTTGQARSSVLAMSDINAGTGGDADRLQRNLYNLSQVENQGKLTGLDVRQFRQNLVPIDKALSKYLNKSIAQIQEMIPKGEISAADVRNSLIQLSQAPEFKGRGKALSEELPEGQWEKTREELDKTSELVGQSLAPAFANLNKILRGAVKITQNPVAGAALGWGGAAVGGAAGIAATGMVGRATTGMVGQAFPALQKLPGVGGLFGEYGMKANTTATALNTQALHANTIAQGKGAVGNVVGGGAGLVGSAAGAGAAGTAATTGAVATALASPVIIGAAAVLAAGVAVALYQNKLNDDDDKRPENNPDAPNEIPGDPRVPAQMTAQQKAAYYRDVAANARGNMNKKLDELPSWRREMIDPNDPESWNRARENATQSQSKAIDDAETEWKYSRGAVKRARRLERNVGADQETGTQTSRDDEFKKWAQSQGAAYVPTRDWSDPNSQGTSGGEKAGMAQVIKIVETGETGRLITLQLPPTQQERDLRSATQKPF